MLRLKPSQTFSLTTALKPWLLILRGLPGFSPYFSALLGNYQYLNGIKLLADGLNKKSLTLL